MFRFLCTTLCVLSFTSVYADAVSNEEEMGSTVEIPLVEPSFAPEIKQAPQTPFSPFTGKIRGRKVRLRAQPDLESHVISELSKNDLVSIVGEKGDFWAVEPPSGTKAFVFRTFVLDKVVEGNRVNVRLEPNVEAPIIGHLNAGDEIKGDISSLNNKWYEIAPPAGTRFYIAKEFIDNIGGLEVKVKMDKRRETAKQLLDAAILLTKAEFLKNFDEIDLERLSRSYKTVINDYNDFPEFVDQAKGTLVALQETYLQKKIAHLESKASQNQEKAIALDSLPYSNVEATTDRMKLWEPIEEALYLSWAQMYDNNDLNEYYEEQQLAATALSGILEVYAAPVKNKPGDFILRENEIPVAYLYSSHINLQDHVGKQVTVIAAPRPNNNFAFPAYFVLSVE